MPLLEICVDDAGGARAAVEGGADRIELCAALGVGGLTPSAGLAVFAVALGIPVRAMIRPRAGDFVFDEGDERVIREDIARLLALGVEGVVLGASREDGRLDVDRLERWVAIARSEGARGLTLHRAIDLTPDLEQAVDEAAALGFDTVLSSGGALTALEGATQLAKMRQRAPASLTIMAGSGVSAQTVGVLVDASGVTAVHASARTEVKSADPKLAAFGFSQSVERTATAATVRALRNAVDRVG
jgi:copper homeostasis protein